MKVEIPEQFPIDFGFCLRIGQPQNSPIVRMHSRCAYGEIFGSLHCDCGPQLQTSIDYMKNNGGGLFFYLEQEGRGAGLEAKAAAYLANELNGIDTFEYYQHAIGSADPRDYSPVANFLVANGIQKVRLITNNPEKTMALKNAGIAVERVRIRTELSSHSLEYVAAKRAQGHDI